MAGGRVLDTREGGPYPWKTIYLLWTESLDTHPQIFMPKHYDSDLNYPHKIMFEYLALSFRHQWEGRRALRRWCRLGNGTSPRVGLEGYIY